MQVIIFPKKGKNLIVLKAYAIMPVGKNDESAHKAQKSHEVQLVAFSIPFWQGGLFLRLTTCLFIFVQPFANIVANYTRHDRDDKR